MILSIGFLQLFVWKGGVAMASSLLSKHHLSNRPFLPRPSFFSRASSRRCFFLSSHLSSAHSITTCCLSRDFGLPPSPSSPVTACDSDLREGFDFSVDAPGQNAESQQFFQDRLNPEPRVGGSLDAVHETTLDRSSVDPAEIDITLSLAQNGNATSGDGFSFREPTEYDFEIYASNSMEGFQQPPPPLPRFGPVFEDYWGEVIGEDTRPKGDEASIRIRNGLLKYLESLKEAEAKENKTKSKSLFGSRANNQPRPIQSYSDYLASKERAGNTLPESSRELSSSGNEDRAGLEEPTEQAASPGERKLWGPLSGLGIDESKPAKGKNVSGDTQLSGPLPRYRVDDAGPAERRIMASNRSLSNFTDGRSVAEADSTERNTILGDSVTSPGHGDPIAPVTDNLHGGRNFTNPTENYQARDTMRGLRDNSFIMNNGSNSFPPASRDRDGDSALSGSRPIGESLGNASTKMPGDTLAGPNSSSDLKPFKREADSRLLEGTLSADKVGDAKPASQSVEDDKSSSNKFEDVKAADKPLENRSSVDKFGGAKPADEPIDDRWAGDRFRDAKPAGRPMEDRLGGDSFGNLRPTDSSWAGNNRDSSVGKRSLSESRPSEMVANIVPEPLENVVDSKGEQSIFGPKQEKDSVSMAPEVDCKRVDNSMSLKPGELEGNLVSTANLPGITAMQADAPVNTNVPDALMERHRNSSEEDTVHYVPRVSDIVLGVVVSGLDNKLELEIGAEQPGLMLSKDLRPFLDPNPENSFFELPSIDESQKLEGFVAPLGKSLVVQDRTVYNGASSMSSSVDFGTVVTAEVQGLTLGDGRAVLSARPPARRMAWHRIKQLMQLGESINIQMVQCNDGGLLGFLEGVRSFLPRSELLQRPENTAALSKYIGRTLPVVILQAEEGTGNLIISELSSWKRKNLRLGTVHDATVTRVYSYGMQVEVNNTRVRGFVHISNISKEFVRRVEDLFTEGEKVKVMLIRGRDSHQVSFSISELESDKGLIFRDKERVFCEAEEIARRFGENLSEEGQQVFSQPVQNELKFEGPVIANMNWLHLGNEL